MFKKTIYAFSFVLLVFVASFATQVVETKKADTAVMTKEMQDSMTPWRSFRDLRMEIAGLSRARCIIETTSCKKI